MPTPGELSQLRARALREARAKREANAPTASAPTRKSGDGIDRAALWKKAHKRAAELPATRD